MISMLFFCRKMSFHVKVNPFRDLLNTKTKMPTVSPSKIIGITGGIGAGKSVVAKVFSVLGISVFDADSAAKNLVVTNQKLKESIIELLGNESYINNIYNRSFVASQIFNNYTLLEKLNSLIHPAVRLYAKEWAKKQKNSPYLLYEEALMNAAGKDSIFDKIIVVTAPLPLRINRIKVRDNRTDKEISTIIAKQLTETERLKFADYVVENDESTSVIDQVLAVHQNILAFY